MTEINRFIHLLYVPTMGCNMQCRYCYLEENTVDSWKDFDSLETLKSAVEKFIAAGVMPFNISLHGGEVTTLPHDEFRALINYISRYYEQNSDIISGAGFKVGRPHIKTNLFGLDRHIDTIKEYEVSVSGSLDLPLSMHDRYRVTKGGAGTLDRILENVRLLEDTPNRKKVSATLFAEHMEHLDEIVKDIRYLHENTCLDMNDFNFMIGFDYDSNGLLHHMSGEQQLELYNRMHSEFDGTDLDAGVNGPWFDEFGPGYCTNCDNCGEKFFLLEKNGDIYSCVRGQKVPDYFYGNIFKDTVEEILRTASQRMYINHNKNPFSDECANCGYLYLCKTGCPFVKDIYSSSRSYTCLLQKKMYEDRGYEKDPFNDEFVYEYVTKMRIEDPAPYRPEDVPDNGIPPLSKLIEEDKRLKYIYDSESFIFKAGDQLYALGSQITKPSRDIVYLAHGIRSFIYMKKELIEAECDYPENNSLYMMLLSGNTVTYGDENRNKQRHVATHQVYKGVLDSICSDIPGYYMFEVTGLIEAYRGAYSSSSPNNMFFTTSSLRDYHYVKQKNNAYYHIQAMNLPFQNIEFYFIDEEF